MKSFHELRKELGEYGMTPAMMKKAGIENPLQGKKYPYNEMSAKAHYKKYQSKFRVPPIDKKRYPNREKEGLEGPYRSKKSGKVFYYDKKAGKYYDTDSDMYLSVNDVMESVEMDERFGGDTDIPANPKTKKYIESGKGIIVDVQSSLHSTARFAIYKNPAKGSGQDKVIMATISNPKRGKVKMFSFHGSHVSHQKAMDFAAKHKLIALKDKDGNRLHSKYESVELDEALSSREAKDLENGVYDAVMDMLHQDAMHTDLDLGDKDVKKAVTKATQRVAKDISRMKSESVELDERTSGPTRMAIDKEFTKMTRSGRMDTMAAIKHVEKMFKVKNVKVAKDKRGKPYVISFQESVELDEVKRDDPHFLKSGRFHKEVHAELKKVMDSKYYREFRASNGGRALDNVINHMGKSRGYRVDKTVKSIIDKYGKNRDEFVKLSFQSAAKGRIREEVEQLDEVAYVKVKRGKYKGMTGIVYSSNGYENSTYLVSGNKLAGDGKPKIISSDNLENAKGSDRKTLIKIHADAKNKIPGHQQAKRQMKESVELDEGAKIVTNPQLRIGLGKGIPAGGYNTAEVAKQVKKAVKKHTTGKLVVRSKGGKSRFIMVRADSIDNKLRKMMLDVVAPKANVRDKSNISYGNISSNMISASVDHWVKALGLKEAMTDAEMKKLGITNPLKGKKYPYQDEGKQMKEQTLLQRAMRLVSEEKGDKEAYNKFFQSALKKFGVNSPSELEGDNKKKFYDYVDKNWKSDKEKETGQEDPKESVELDEAGDPRIAKMSFKAKEILANMANSLDTTGGPYLDKTNVKHLTRRGVENTLKAAQRIPKGNKNAWKDIALIKKELGESVEEAKTVPLMRTGQGSYKKDTHPKRKDGKIERMYQAKDKNEYAMLIMSADTGRRGNAYSVKGSEKKLTVTVVFDNDKQRQAYEKKMRIKEGAEMDIAKEKEKVARSQEKIRDLNVKMKKEKQRKRDES